MSTAMAEGVGISEAEKRANEEYAKKLLTKWHNHGLVKSSVFKRCCDPLSNRKICTIRTVFGTEQVDFDLLWYQCCLDNIDKRVIYYSSFNEYIKHYAKIEMGQYVPNDSYRRDLYRKVLRAFDNLGVDARIFQNEKNKFLITQYLACLFDYILLQHFDVKQDAINASRNTQQKIRRLLANAMDSFDTLIPVEKRAQVQAAFVEKFKIETLIVSKMPLFVHERLLAAVAAKTAKDNVINYALVLNEKKGIDRLVKMWDIFVEELDLEIDRIINGVRDDITSGKI